MPTKETLPLDSLSSPQEALDWFNNAMRKSVDYDGLNNKIVVYDKVQVLSNPQPLSAIDATAVQGDPKNPAESASTIGKYTFKGRIRDENSPHDFLPDPCNLTYATDAESAKRVLALHTTYITTPGHVPKKFSYVKVQHRLNVYGPDLQYGRCVEVTEGSNLSPNDFVQGAKCELLEDLFEGGDVLPLGSGEYPEDSKSLDSLEPNFKKLVDTLIKNMKARGFSTNVVTAFRSIETQMAAVKKGHSKATFGYHNFMDADGNPASQAVDLVSKTVGYGGEDPEADSHKSAVKYFKALGEEAMKLGLRWGGSYTKINPLWSRHGMGWDPAHVELITTPGMAMAQAKQVAQQQGIPV